MSKMNIYKNIKKKDKLIKNNFIPNSINNNELSNSEDTLLCTSIYQSNQNIASKIDSIIGNVNSEKESALAAIDAEIARQEEIERQEALKDDDDSKEGE